MSNKILKNMKVSILLFFTQAALRVFNSVAASLATSIPKFLKLCCDTDWEQLIEESEFSFTNVVRR